MALKQIPDSGNNWKPDGDESYRSVENANRGKNYRKGCNKSLKGEGSTMTRELKTINPATEESH